MTYLLTNTFNNHLDKLENIRASLMNDSPLVVGAVLDTLNLLEQLIETLDMEAYRAQGLNSDDE